MLQKYDRGASNHVYDNVTGEESWICAYKPESKQQSTVWVFQDEPNPTKVTRARSTSKQMIACFLKLEQRRIVNSEWYTTICLPIVFTRNQENQPPKTDNSSPRQCKLPNIGPNNCIFEHSKHRFDELSPV